jgi:hypothetical protein
MNASQTLRKPYLIQRANIVKPLSPKNQAGKVTLSKSVSFDYMGSSEFEFGALPKSLKRLHAAYKEKGLKTRLLNNITEGDSQLRVVSALSNEEFETYAEYLVELRYKNPRLKESSYFGHDHTKEYRYLSADFWWDIENDVMFSFNKEYMNRLQLHLSASWNIMELN